MRVLYLTTWDFSKEASDGVCKKINAQIKVFRANGYAVDMIFVKGNDVIYEKDGKRELIGHVPIYKKTAAYIVMYKYLKNEHYDVVYNRFGLMDTFYYRVLKRLKKNGAKIIVEIPAYPYKGERLPGFLFWLMFKWDDIYLHKVNRVVDRIITFFDTDEDIWNITTLQIPNGIDVESMKTVSLQKENDGVINCIAVAMFQPYHGYDRMIKGIKEYVNAGGNRKIHLHLVGGGPEEATYRKLIEDENIGEYVTMYGPMSGEPLDEIYDKCDIAIASLGMFRIGQMGRASSLKTREYMAKGLPIVAGNPMDVGDESFPYYLVCSNDETPLDIESIINFYDDIYSGYGGTSKGYSEIKAEVISYMRKWAEETCDWKNTFKPVLEFISGEGSHG